MLQQRREASQRECPSLVKRVRLNSRGPRLIHPPTPLPPPSLRPLLSPFSSRQAGLSSCIWLAYISHIRFILRVPSRSSEVLLILPHHLLPLCPPITTMFFSCVPYTDTRLYGSKRNSRGTRWNSDCPGACHDYCVLYLQHCTHQHAQYGSHDQHGCPCDGIFFSSYQLWHQLAPNSHKCVPSS